MHVTLKIQGENKYYPAGTSYQEIAKEYQKDDADDIVLVRLRKGSPAGTVPVKNGDSVQTHLRELSKKVSCDGEVQFVTTADKAGRSTYRRSVTFLMEAAAHALYPEMSVFVQHSLGQGYYCEFRRDGVLLATDPAWLPPLKEKMEEMVRADVPIVKKNVHTDEAVEYFKSAGRADKAGLLRYRRSSRINLYRLGDYQDYYYGYMVPSAGYLKAFDLFSYQNGFMLMFPNADTKHVAEFHAMDKLFGILDESSAWGESMGVRTIAELNDVIAAGKIQDLILVQESWMEQKIGDIAEQIASDPRKKIVLIAGPSSSGKTTFSHRLSIQLTAQGLRPHPISLDDFYVNREDTPKDETGEYDFECLEAIDISLFNQCLNDLLSGKEVFLPAFNFRTGRREFRNQPLKLDAEDVLVIEGIHGLNEKLSWQLPKESKFKIYISALTQLNVDEQNNLATTDGRLIRRMVRDARTRNTTARETLARWDSVRRGEERNIFPYQEEADVMFNSALIYELPVLKVYAEPLLFSIDSDCPEYEEAKRLLKILDYTLPVPGETIGSNSILREFMGGGCFGV